MVNQPKDLKLKRDKKRLSQTRKEKSVKSEIENARKKESKLLNKTRSKDCMYKFYLLKFFYSESRYFFRNFN